MSFAISVALLAAVVAVTCALPGTVLVLRRQAMMSDAMAHALRWRRCGRIRQPRRG